MGPPGGAPKNSLKLPRVHCKSRIRSIATGSLAGTERMHASHWLNAASRAVVRNRRHGGWLVVARKRRILRIEKCSVGGAQLKTGDGVVKKIDGVEEMVRRRIDSDGDRLQAGGVCCQCELSAPLEQWSRRSRWRPASWPHRHKDKTDRRRWRRADCRRGMGCRRAASSCPTLTV